jgi:Leucine-rich repeat (LRR) protein
MLKEYKTYMLIFIIFMHMRIIRSQECTLTLTYYHMRAENIMKLFNQTNDQIERASFDKVIDLSYSNISFYNLDITVLNKNFPILSELKLSKNDLKIVALNLAKNSIKYIEPNAFDRLLLLEKLDLKNNLIESIENRFGNLVSLKYLDLSFNQLEYIDQFSLENLKNLEFLMLNNNNISKIGSIFIPRGSLLSLEKSKNKTPPKQPTNKRRLCRQNFIDDDEDENKKKNKALCS